LAVPWFTIALLAPAALFSQTPFYHGKTIKIINNDPGGTAGTRVNVVVSYLRKYMPGNPTIVVEYIQGGGGRKAANQVYRSTPDGLTVGALSSSTIGLQVMKETGVLYDIDRFIYLGTPVSENHNVIYTRRELGLDSMEKLRQPPAFASAPRKWAASPTSAAGSSPIFWISKSQSSSPAIHRRTLMLR
jgi:tripartite-type tricarboxylate transporter receptor subunit TctC